MFLRNWGGFFSRPKQVYLDKEELLNNLVIAITNKKSELVAYWLSMVQAEGYSVETLWFKDFTLLHLAIMKTNYKDQETILPILQLLYEAGMDINTSARDPLGTYPIISAARRGLPKVVAWLIAHQANTSVRDSTRKRAQDYLEQAIEYKKQVANQNDELEVIKRLEETKALLNIASQENSLLMRW